MGDERATIKVIIDWLLQDMTERDRLMEEWYRDRGVVEVRAQFTARFEILNMIGTEFQAMKATLEQLNE